MSATNDDLVLDHAALRGGVGAVWLERDVLRASGPDAVAFLQGQLSQDVAALAAGGSAWSFLLQPQGKVDAFLRVVRVGADELLLDVDGGFGAAVQERLQRFLLRVKVDLEPLRLRCLALRGPDAAAPEGAGLVVADASWPGLPGIDLLGDDLAVPEGVRLCGPAAYDAARIEAGVPAMGAELTDRTIPAETGLLDRSVSFTKGCYTGQELVARIDSRGGNVPRHLRGVVVEGDAAPPAGARLVDGDGREVGMLTSSALSPALGPVALSFVRRDVEPPADVAVEWDGERAVARVGALPLVS